MINKKETSEYNKEILDFCNESIAHCNNMLYDIRGNFDSYTFDEQLSFDEAAYYYELAVLDFTNYVSAYNKYFDQKIKSNVYRIIQGDTLVTLAIKFYGNPTKWENIYIFNSLVDLDISELDTLQIPEIDLNTDDEPEVGDDLF